MRDLVEAFKERLGFGRSGSNYWVDCPECKERINLGMERCPKCGTHLDSMFRLKCPRCKSENGLRATRCEKCKEPLILPAGAEQKIQYTCPVCGYKADYQMNQCPVCGVRFI